MEGTARKKTQEEEPSVSKNYGATQSYRSILDSGSCLNYDILRIIFKYLNARDLGSAAMICRSWSEAANNEKSTRGPCCFTQYNDNPHSESNDIKNIRIKPSAGFFFIYSIGQDQYLKDRCLEPLEDLLPKYCEVIMLNCEGMSLDHSEIETNYYYTLFLSRVCAFLPQIPNVRIKSFQLAYHRVIQESAEYQEIISTIVGHETSISNHETSTCFMLFCDYRSKSIAQHWASAMQESKEVKIASVWGGVLNEIDISHNHEYRQDCVAVLITGSIQTWSTILDMECYTTEQVEARLKLFKDEVKLKKHSIGFMFSWKTRRDRDLVQAIFKRLFPKVPLANCFGYGSFGKTTTIDEVNEEKNDEEKPWYNEYSIVFLILTYG